MAAVGSENKSAFIRQMTINGLIVKLDIPELKNIISLLCELRDLIRACPDINGQENVLADIREKQDHIIKLANDIIAKLSSIR